MKFILRLLILSIYFSAPGVALAKPQLILDLAKEKVEITTGFNGETLNIYGLVIADDPDRDAYEIAVTIKGPAENMIVRRKEEVFGMWMNRSFVEFKDVYSLYDLSLSAPPEEISDPGTLEKYDIGLDYLSFEPTRKIQDPVSELTFHEAVISTKQSQSLYALTQKDLEFITENFFTTSFRVPASVPTGMYMIEGFLFNEGKLVDHRKKELKVAQVGMNAEIFQFARYNALLYGLTAIFLALAFGWMAHSFLRQD